MWLETLTSLETAARHTSPHRGFLLWRLSDAGRRTSGAVPQAAGIRNPSQKETTVLTVRKSAMPCATIESASTQLDQHFSNVFSLEESKEGIRCLFDAMKNSLAPFDLA